MVALILLAEEFVYLSADYLGLGHCASRPRRNQMHFTQSLFSWHPSVLSGTLEGIVPPPCPVLALGFSQNAAKVPKPPH